MADRIVITVQLFQEGEQFVSYCPQLNVSSFGETPDEAKASLIEAVSLFLEECEQMGTLYEVLEEGGYQLQYHRNLRRWLPRRPIATGRVSIKIA